MELCIKIQLSFEQHLILPNHKPQKFQIPLVFKVPLQQFWTCGNSHPYNIKAKIIVYNTILSVNFLKIKMEEVLIK